MPLGLLNGDEGGWSPPSANWWDTAPGVIAAYRAIGAQSESGSRDNLASPGAFTLTGSCSWAALTGWNFYSGALYLDTGIIANGADYTLAVSFANATANLGVPVGANGGGVAWQIIPRYNYLGDVGYLGSRTNGAGVFVSGDVLSSGVIVSASHLYLDGVDKGPATGGGAPIRSAGLRIGKRSDNNLIYSGFVLAVWVGNLAFSAD